MKNNWWTSFWGVVLCHVIGHAGASIGIYLEPGKEMCDCPEDHRYLGCSRCRKAVFL